MKILWFTNTPCSASERLTPGFNRGGWLSSLEQEFGKRKDIELHIGFYHTEQIDHFLYNNTWFYPLKRRNSSSKVQRYFSRLLKMENNDRDEINQLLKIVDFVKPDLIHVHGTEDNFGLIQNYLQTPVVISLQGILSPYVEKFFSGIPQNIAFKYNSIRSKILFNSSKNKYHSFEVNSLREKKMLSISKNIIGRTEWDKRISRVLAPESHYYKGQEMLRPSFYTHSWQKNKFDKKIKIVTVSSNGVYKGFETIIKTARILSEYPNFDFEWLVIGLQKNSEIVLLTQKWLKINSNSLNINLLGEKNEIEIVDILLNADIYCQVSHIENSPNSLCEAMILGMPIIASYAGGSSTILENKKEGILVQDGDPYVLAGTILEVSSSFEKAKEYGRMARINAMKRHDKTNIVDKLIENYNNIIKG